MPREIDPRAAAQKRSSRLLVGMAAFVAIGIVAYFILLLAANRRTPANPDTRYTGANGVSVYYESDLWPVCRMAEDAALGEVLELATAEDPDDGQYQVVLFQRGDAGSYDDFLEQSQDDLRANYGIISPKKLDITVEGAEAEAVRCDIQAYYAVLATVSYDSGDVLYISALTKLASTGDVLNLIESVSIE